MIFPIMLSSPIGLLFIDCNTIKGNEYNVELQSGLKEQKVAKQGSEQENEGELYTQKVTMCLL